MKPDINYMCTFYAFVHTICWRSSNLINSVGIILHELVTIQTFFVASVCFLITNAAFLLWCSLVNCSNLRHFHFALSRSLERQRNLKRKASVLQLLGVEPSPERNHHHFPNHQTAKDHPAAAANLHLLTNHQTMKDHPAAAALRKTREAR